MNRASLGVNQIGEFSPRSFLAGDYPNSKTPVVLKSGRIYAIGSVLGKATADGVCSLVDSAQSDGTESVYGVLAETVDATAGDAEGIAFLTGEFVQERLAFGGSDTFETHRDSARKAGIFFKPAALRPNQ